MAFLGALGTIMLVYTLARQPGGAAPVHTLLLSGIMVNSVFGSIRMFLVSLSSSENSHNVIWWLLGNERYDPGRGTGISSRINMMISPPSRLGALKPADLWGPFGMGILAYESMIDMWNSVTRTHRTFNGTFPDAGQSSCAEIDNLRISV